MDSLVIRKVVGWPPHDNPDLVDLLAEVAREWRRDNGAYCLEILDYLSEQYPWSLEVQEWYGLVYSKIRHIFNDKAMVRLHNYIAAHQIMTNVPYQVNDGLHRYKIMKDILSEWLLEKSCQCGYDKKTGYRTDFYCEVHDKGDIPQWARIIDIGCQMGEMAINWIGRPGAKDCFAMDISFGNVQMGRKCYADDRLHWAQGIAHALPIKDHCMDVAFLAGILEHVRNPDDLVAEAERVLKPGGLMVIDVPYGGSEGAPNRAADVLGWRSHVRCIDPRVYVKDRKIVAFHYVDYTNNVNFPHGLVGTNGNYTLAFEV